MAGIKKQALGEPYGLRQKKSAQKLGYLAQLRCHAVCYCVLWNLFRYPAKRALSGLNQLLVCKIRISGIAFSLAREPPPFMGNKKGAIFKPRIIPIIKDSSVRQLTWLFAITSLVYSSFGKIDL